MGGGRRHDSETLVPTIPQADIVHIVVVGRPTGKSDLVRHIGAPTMTKEIATFS